MKSGRKLRDLSLEAFSDVSDRTYLGSRKRDLKIPMMNKLAELCEITEVHPLTLLTLAAARGMAISDWHWSGNLRQTR